MFDARIKGRGNGRGARFGVFAGLVALALVWALAGCQSGPRFSAKEGPVVVGASLPLSGPDARSGEDARRGMELAREQVNAAGGIGGRPLVIVYTDNQSDAGEGLYRVNRLREDVGTPFLIVAQTNVCRTVGEAYSEDPVFVQFLTAFPPIPLTTPNGVRVFLNGTQEIKQLMELVRVTGGAERVVVLYVSDDYGESCMRYLVYHLRGDGVFVNQDGYVRGERNFTLLGHQIERVKPDAVFVVGYGPEYPAILKGLEDVRWRGPVWLLTGDGRNPEHVGELARERGKVRWVAPVFLSDPCDSSKAFQAEFERVHGEKPGLYGAFGYDNVKLLADAMEKAGLDPKAVREAMIRTQGYSGASGPLTFQKDGDTEAALVAGGTGSRKSVE